MSHKARQIFKELKDAMDSCDYELSYYLTKKLFMEMQITGVDYD